MPSGRRVAASGNTGVMTATRHFAAIPTTDARGFAIKPWDHWPGKSGTAARHPSEASELTLGKDRNGASRAAPAAKPEGPLWVQRGDLRRGVWQRRGCVVERTRSRGREQLSGSVCFDGVMHGSA